MVQSHILQVSDLLKEWRKPMDLNLLEHVFGIAIIQDVKITNTDLMITGDVTFATIH